MNELIKITTNEKGQQLVSARELYDFLEVKKDFTDWFKYRVGQYDFEEEKDFTTILGKSTGGRPSKDYAVTIEMAKELSMVENNDKGKEARRYFIKCEKKAKQIPQLSKEVQAIFLLDQRTVEIENKITSLESSLPLFNVECKELQALVRKVGINALGGKSQPAYKDNSLRGKIYADIQHQLKREFGVTRYEAIKRCQLNQAREIVEGYKAPIVLQEEIRQINSQVNFKEVI